MGDRINSPTIVLTANEQKDLDILCRAIITVKSEVEVVANDKAQGNRAVFDIIVRRIGLHPSAPHGKHIRIAEFLASEKGYFHFRVPSEGKKVIYNFNYGTVAAEGALPTASITISVDHTELLMGGFTSGTIIAMQYAAQMTPSPKKLITSAAISSDKVASKKVVAPSGVLVILPTNKKGKISLMHGVIYLHFSDIFYFRIP